MQPMTLHPYRDPDAPGLLYVLARVRQVEAVRFRTLKFLDGTPLEMIQREAERMALERWPGEMSVRLMLTMGDCGDVHVLPTPDPHPEDADEDARQKCGKR